VAEASVSTTIREQCERLGFARWGLCAAEPVPREDFWRRYLAAGRHGEMTWLEETVDVRLDPSRLLEGARTILMVADLYRRKGEAAQGEASTPGEGKIARYARGRDYHKSLKKRLHQLADALREQMPEETFRVAVDTAPLAEREHAARAGLGWIAKHTLLIHPDLGSYFFLGAIVTTADLPVPAGQTTVVDHCGSCTACIEACPTDAITPYEVDARRCISYLTIEHRSAVDPALQEGVGDWLFGCDVCQEVCPHNSPAAAVDETAAHPDYAPRRRSAPLASVLDWAEAGRRELVRGTAMNRAKLAMWRRNAIVCLGNDIPRNPNPRVRERLVEIASSEAEESSVRQAAADVLNRLGVPRTDPEQGAAGAGGSAVG
jgi:epoxyqueuosine reductase